ncbi:TetR family transcriptional regulator [Sphingomonas suaedae]|uniref:TetR family transcriptional regulator n=1 Tax=Sphingomonas suaedae TaxID=2599297 RepID=A0A518RGB7_9SPHN|nr:TetR family transcriptional regulator [Sphingomonas suaedae]QDX26444.1 TetR family transcriptional regulator [Sphingomonas suaedae]
MDHKIAKRATVSSDARVVRSRAALRAALIELVGERPFAEISVAALTERAGVGYATFFRHYPDLSAVLTEVADGLIAELLELLVPLLRARDGLAVMRALTAEVAARRQLAHALLTGAGDSMRQTITRRAIDQAMAAPTDTPGGLPRELAVTHLVGATLTILTWWLDRAPETAADDVAAMLDRLVLAPVLEDQLPG